MILYRRPPKLDQFNSQPLYPTEDLLWDENIMNTEYYTGLQCLALPKLGIQFLTLHDYLVRNYNLFRLESTYEIRLEIEDQIARMKPWVGRGRQKAKHGLAWISKSEIYFESKYLIWCCPKNFQFKYLNYFSLTKLKRKTLDFISLKKCLGKILKIKIFDLTFSEKFSSENIWLDLAQLFSNQNDRQKIFAGLSLKNSKYSKFF